MEHWSKVYEIADPESLSKKSRISSEDAEQFTAKEKQSSESAPSADFVSFGQ
jgi:hypothetical protein